jgi:hypothetical protein
VTGIVSIHLRGQVILDAGFFDDSQLRFEIERMMFLVANYHVLHDGGEFRTQCRIQCFMTCALPCMKPPPGQGWIQEASGYWKRGRGRKEHRRTTIITATRASGTAIPAARTLPSRCFTIPVPRITSDWLTSQRRPPCTLASIQRQGSHYFEMRDLEDNVIEISEEA